MTITMEHVKAGTIAIGIFYGLPALIAYAADRIVDGDQETNWGMVLMPGFNLITALIGMGAIIDHYFPSPPGPAERILESLRQDMESGEYGRRERMPQYINDFIEQKGLRAELNDYIDAMELARKMQNPEAK